MAKHGVLVDLELAVRRHQPAVAGEREWFDLDGQRIVGPAERVELGDQRRELRLQGAEPGAEDKVADLEGERAACAASSGLFASRPSGTGMPAARNRSFTWYSRNFKGGCFRDGELGVPPACPAEGAGTGLRWAGSPVAR